MRILLKRWADAALRSTLAKTENVLADTLSEVEAIKRQLAVVAIERDELAAVVARNRARVKAEIAAASKEQAMHERNGRADESTD